MQLVWVEPEIFLIYPQGDASAAGLKPYFEQWGCRLAESIIFFFCLEQEYVSLKITFFMY